jgi:hypothetical protein
MAGRERVVERCEANRVNKREQIPLDFPQFGGGIHALFAFENWGNGSGRCVEARILRAFRGAAGKD